MQLKIWLIETRVETSNNTFFFSDVSCFLLEFGVQSFYFLAEEQDFVVVLSDLIVFLLQFAALGLGRCGRVERRKFCLFGGEESILLP